MATFFNSYQIFKGAVFQRYRLESFVLSALLIRKWMDAQDRLALVTDSETLKVFLALDLTSIYDDVIIPEEVDGVDPQYFSALIKLRGLHYLAAPVYSVDWDLFILCQSLFDNIRESKVCGLHYECTCSPAYKTPEQYEHLLPDGDFDKAPINTSIISFSSNADKKRYCDFVFEFMRRYTESPVPVKHAMHLMQFAEQQLLGYLRTELGIKVFFKQGANGYFHDHSCFHIWGMKDSLDGDKTKSDEHRIWCREVMNQLGMDVPKLLDCPAAKALL